MERRSAFWLVFGFAMLAAASDAGIACAEDKPAEAYVPGLGDFMTAYVQPHHIKLFLAGSARNWKLAAYEASEIGETFEDVVSYQGKWHDLPVGDLVKTNIDPALAAVTKAIEAKDENGFKTAYGKLTAACNSCHAAAAHEFVVIKTPAASAFPDQEFGRK